jgi:hypothetical protein
MRRQSIVQLCGLRVQHGKLDAAIAAKLKELGYGG